MTTSFGIDSNFYARVCLRVCVHACVVLLLLLFYGIFRFLFFSSFVVFLISNLNIYKYIVIISLME